MSLSIAAGLSLEEFYDAELFEISIIIDGFLQRESEFFKNQWETARFQMSAMVDTKKIRFPWDESTTEITPELWKLTRGNFKKWEENFNKNYK